MPFAFANRQSLVAANPAPLARTARRSSLGSSLVLSLLLAAGTQLAALQTTVASAAPLSDTPSAPQAEFSAAPASDLELALVARVNADRAANGLAPLTFDPNLLAIARRRAADQVPLPQLSHYDAAGQVAVAPLLADAQVSYQLAGENLVRLPGPDATTADRAEEALMHSPTHRANILEARFDEVAIGEATDTSGRVVFAQIFRATA